MNMHTAKAPLELVDELRKDAMVADARGWTCIGALLRETADEIPKRVARWMQREKEKRK